MEQHKVTHFVKWEQILSGSYWYSNLMISKILKKSIISCLVLFVFVVGRAQNKGVIVAPFHSMNVEFNADFTPLPTHGPSNSNYLEGYKGQSARGGQNIIVDGNGDIVFFIVDEYIYDRNGKLIDVFTMMSSDNPDAGVFGAMSEIMVVPVPGDCQAYYLFSTRVNDSGVSFAFGFYGKLVVKYNAQGDILPGSGLEIFHFPSGSVIDYGKARRIGDLIGSQYFANNNVHDEGPRFAVVQKTINENKLIFVQNGTKLFVLEIDENGIHYTNNFVKLMDIYTEDLSMSEMLNRRQELEAILLPNGQVRVGFAIDHSIYANPGAARSVKILDFDQNGNFIPGSQKAALYHIASGFPGHNFDINGIEFSQDGSKLYVSHIPSIDFPGSLDVWDLSGTNPVKTTIATGDQFQYSQIEATFGDKMLIAHAGGLAAINNASNPFVSTNLDMNYQAFNMPFSNAFLNNCPGCFLYLLQDQMSGFDYSSIFSPVYEVGYYQTTAANAVWTPNGQGVGNPLVVGGGTIAHIKNELRVKAGTSLTIRNMELHFSPGARLVIENGANGVQGGKLVLDRAILTNDKQCHDNQLWLGVEVWGNQNQFQGSINNSSQGRLVIANNSIIENARIGVLVGKRTTEVVETPFDPALNYAGGSVEEIQVNPNSFDNARTGGIVQAFSSTLLNNQTAVWFKPYSYLGINSQSYFSLVNFLWDRPLLGNVDLKWLVCLEEFKGVGFSGCKFSNLDPDAFADFKWGIGIFSRESQFYVNPRCNNPVIGQPCSSKTLCEFNNLRSGIYATNSNGLSFTCTESEFTNNQYGIFVRGTKSEKYFSINLL